MEDDFFSKTKCDRCGEELSVRIMSWFTEETICMTCSEAEKVIKKQLRDLGIKGAMEGCGYIPNPLNFHKMDGGVPQAKTKL